MAERYQLGLNIALSAGWAMQVYFSHTQDSEFNHLLGSANKNAVSAALGWTVNATPASGTTPAVATWTKPASVPYLNLFCDARQFQCNSPQTLRLEQRAVEHHRLHGLRTAFFHVQPSPPNVNFACLTEGGSVGGGTYPCAIMGYTNIVPSYYTFDLSVGYNTLDSPANEYLRNISVQLVVQNITDKHAPYQYRLTGAGGGGQPCACDILKSLYGRIISLRLQKTF